MESWKKIINDLYGAIVLTGYIFICIYFGAYLQYSNPEAFINAKWTFVMSVGIVVFNIIINVYKFMKE